MFGWFRSQAAVLADIEQRLLPLIPLKVRSLQIDQPVYCLRIWYHGTDTLDDDCSPSLMLVTEAARKKLLAERGESGMRAIWFADELTYPEWTFEREIEEPDVAKLCKRWYRRISGDEEREALAPFRQMVQRLAAKLNRLDWRNFTQATDDFVVFPADSSHVFCDDYGDMKASVPQDKLNHLLTRKLLDPKFGANR